MKIKRQPTWQRTPVREEIVAMWPLLMEFKYLIDPNLRKEKGTPRLNHRNIVAKLLAVCGFSRNELKIGGRISKKTKEKNIEERPRIKYILFVSLPNCLKFPEEKALEARNPYP
mmetsp:Transcript_25119/g.26196  ORF Transcript_25119/g.26196 Transcript_25119/m.26196 type:complete len:114 (-) Transcript_25119:22-363(-)